MVPIQQVIDDYVNDNQTTKVALAQKLGIGRTALFMKLRGSSEFTLGEAYKLSRELGITLDQFYELVVA